VDSGYPNKIGYLAPFKGSTYHLPEFHHRRGRPPQGKYEIFNYLHSSLRNVIERSFGVLKQKWRILKAMPRFSTRKQAKIIIACIALHNFIRDSHLSDKEFDRCDANEEYMPRAAHATAAAAAAAQQGDEVEGHNEVTMNSIREMIADGLVSQ
jgi:hypothetical protein